MKIGHPYISSARCLNELQNLRKLQSWRETQRWLPDDMHSYKKLESMMTSSNGNIIHVTDPFVKGIHRHRWVPLTKAIDAELWCFLWSAPEQTAEQTNETPVIWDAIVLIITSLSCVCIMMEHICIKPPDVLPPCRTPLYCTSITKQNHGTWVAWSIDSLHSTSVINV